MQVMVVVLRSSRYVEPFPLRSLTASSRCNLSQGSVLGRIENIVGLSANETQNFNSITETGIRTVGMIFKFEVVGSVKRRTCAKENIKIPPLNINI